MSSIRVCVILSTAVKMILKPRYSYIRTTVRCPSQQHRHLMQHTADRAGLDQLQVQKDTYSVVHTGNFLTNTHTHTN